MPGWQRSLRLPRRRVIKTCPCGDREGAPVSVRIRARARAGPVAAIRMRNTDAVEPALAEVHSTMMTRIVVETYHIARMQPPTEGSVYREADGHVHPHPIARHMIVSPIKRQLHHGEGSPQPPPGAGFTLAWAAASQRRCAVGCCCCSDAKRSRSRPASILSPRPRRQR